jgi:hypothetical protein
MMIMNVTKRLISMAAGLLILGTAIQAQATVINFNEVALPSLTLLDGTTYYDSYGISFADETFSAVDNRFAQTDNAGITSTDGINNLVTVNFTDSISFLEFGWLTILSNDLFADAYDVFGDLVDSFSISGLSGDSTGVASLSGSGITSVTWHDGTGRIGIDYLNFTADVDAPSVLTVMLLGLIGLGLRRYIA